MSELLVAGQPVDTIVNAQAEEQGGKDHREDIEMTNDQGGQPEGERQGNEELEHLKKWSSNTTPEENKQQSKTSGGNRRGKAHVPHGSVHLIHAQCLRPGDAYLETGKILLHGTDLRAQAGKGRPGPDKSLFQGRRRDKKEQIPAVFRGEISLILTGVITALQEGVPGRDITASFQIGVQGGESAG